MFGKLLDRKDYLLEMFIISNLAFLAVDILISHSVNNFSHVAEWIPVGFSIVAPFLLVIIYLRNIEKRPLKNEPVGFVIALISIVIGILGMYYHLESQFSFYFSAKSLVYSAPIAAPFFYAAMGLLLILNRKISSNSPDWGRQILNLAMIGFLVNYLLCLLDHEQNGFYHITEWIPVISAALGAAVLIPLSYFRMSDLYYKLIFGVIGLQFLVGVLGFVFHFYSIITGPSAYFVRNFVNGPPPFAPLLFADLAILSLLGLYQLKTESAVGEVTGKNLSNTPA